MVRAALQGGVAEGWREPRAVHALDRTEASCLFQTHVWLQTLGVKQGSEAEAAAEGCGGREAPG